jgi:hypothetical protein
MAVKNAIRRTHTGYLVPGMVNLGAITVLFWGLFFPACTFPGKPNCRMTDRLIW